MIVINNCRKYVLESLILSLKISDEKLRLVFRKKYCNVMYRNAQNKYPLHLRFI